MIFAFLLTLGAGLATSLGSLLGVMSRRFSPGLLTLALSFSAGVMLFISFVEIFPKARQILTSALGSSTGYLVAVLAFFGGMFAMAMVDRCLPAHGLPLQGVRPGESSSALMRTGLFSALAIAIHNFPEGLATFVAALSEPRLGAGIALAIAIHNVPEGLRFQPPSTTPQGVGAVPFWLPSSQAWLSPLGPWLAICF